MQLTDAWFSKNSPPEDEMLLVKLACKARDKGHENDAFATLYRTYVNPIYRYLLARMGNSADAQDLTAQTFLLALQNLHKYRSDGSFAAWLFGIARRKTADYYRRHKPVVALIEIESAVAQPEEIVSERLQLERVMEVLQAIVPERAEALTLHIFGGLNMAEVGHVMGKSEAAAKMLVHRALRDLRQRLREE